MGLWDGAGGWEGLGSVDQSAAPDSGNGTGLGRPVSLQPALLTPLLSPKGNLPMPSPFPTSHRAAGKVERLWRVGSGQGERGDHWGRGRMTPAHECRVALSATPPRPCPGPRPTPPPPRAAFHTFILGGVVDVKVAIPHNHQLHRQVVDLHPFIGILQPGGGRKEGSWVTAFQRGSMCSLGPSRAHGTKDWP